MMRILLVRPALKLLGWWGRESTGLVADKDSAVVVQLTSYFYNRGRPIAVEMVAASVPERHEVHILDLCNADDSSLEEELAAFQPGIVGVSCTFTCAINSTLHTLRRIRAASPDAFVIVGGHAPSMAPEYFADEADAVAVGEGEVILPPLIERLEQGRDWHDLPGLAYHVNGVLCRPASGPALVGDLDGVPPPAERRLPHYVGQWRPPTGQVEPLFTSRGCPGRCSFCAGGNSSHGRYRWMSAERAVKEIEVLPVSCVGCLDANFMANVPRARRIAELLLERGVQKRYFFKARSDSITRHPEVLELWKRAGLSDVFCGFESTDEDWLADMRKGSTVDLNCQAVDILHSYGLKVAARFIIRPDFVEADFERLRRFIVDYSIDLPQFTLLTPYPGTELWAQCSGRLVTRNWDHFDGNHAVLPTSLSPIRFYQACFELASSTLPRQ